MRAAAELSDAVLDGESLFDSFNKSLGIKRREKKVNFVSGWARLDVEFNMQIWRRKLIEIICIFAQYCVYFLFICNYFNKYFVTVCRSLSLFLPLVLLLTIIMISVMNFFLTDGHIKYICSDYYPHIDTE